MKEERDKESEMRLAGWLGVTLLLTAFCARPGAVWSQPAPTTKPALVPARSDFKVIIWFRRDQPLQTFKYQVYDVRKGEYTPAVDTWLELMRTKYRGYEVTVRDVDLTREKGQTEALKVGSVIKRELMAVASLEGIFIGEGVSGGLTRSLTPWPGLPAPLGGASPAMTRALRPSRAIELNSPSPTFPVPMPYPRPHP
jgi:hypothetical protein